MSHDIELGNLNENQEVYNINGNIPDELDAEPLMHGDDSVELRFSSDDDPIYNEFERGDVRYLQSLIEKLILYPKHQLKDAILHLRREILLSDTNTLDAEDGGGLSTKDVLAQLQPDQRTEYHQPMCMLERLLWALIQIEYKDQQLTDVVELILVKSEKDYENYKNRRVLTLLQKYDVVSKPSVKYLQWQVLSGTAERYVKSRNESNSQRSSSYTTANFEADDSNANLENDELLFWSKLEEALEKNLKFLDEVFEAIFPSGSIELLKYLLNKIDEKNLKEKLECPVIVNAVYWCIYVKDQNMDAFHRCFDYALEKEKNNLHDREPQYGDTALHIANELKDKYMIKALLKNHPPIATKSKQEKFPISNISKDDLKQFLDSLITDIPSKFLTSLDVWKIIKAIFISEYKLDGVIFMNLNTFVSKDINNKNEEFNDLEFIKEIKDSNEQNELIDHPVIRTLLELNWIKFQYWIVFDQFFAIIAAVLYLTSCLIVVKYIKQSLSESLDLSIFIVTLILINLELLNNFQVFVQIFEYIFEKLKQVIRKLTEMVTILGKTMFDFCKKLNIKNNKKEPAPDEIDHQDNDREFNSVEEDQLDYDEDNVVYDPENEFENVEQKSPFPKYGAISLIFLKLPLLILICMYGCQSCSKDLATCNQIIAIGIIFLSLNLSVLAGYFIKIFAIDLIMFFKVALTGIKFILSTFLILLGFAFSLIKLINNYGLPKPEEGCVKCTTLNATQDEHASESTPQSNFYGLGIFKTIIMSTGEYEAGEIEFTYITSYIVFICFVFAIPIVFINLLNALAIEDVQEIKKEAMIWYRMAQLMVLYEFEILHKSIFKIIFNRKQKTSKIYPNMIGKNAFIGIRIKTREVFSMEDLDDENHKTIGHLSEHVIKNAVKELHLRAN